MKKILFSTLALSTLMVGCSQEELAPIANDSEQTDQGLETVVGHDLVGQISIQLGDETRAFNGGWHADDKLGMAWFDLEGNITDEQTSSKWNDFVAGTLTTNDVIYGNHLFQNVGGDGFATQTNVYQGAHFLYFPFERASKVEKKAVDLNKLPLDASKDEGVSDFDYDRFNRAFHMSTADYISASEVKEDMSMSKEFNISPVTNVLKITATPNQKLAGNDKLKNLKLTGYSVKTGTAVMEGKFDIVTKNIPAARYKLVNGVSVLDRVENIKNIDNKFNFPKSYRPIE